MNDVLITLPRRCGAVLGRCLLAIALFSGAVPAHSHEQNPKSEASLAVGSHEGRIVRADGHAPIGVMGDHYHRRGEWMLSYRYMHMAMEGNRIGTDGVTPEQIVTTVPNRFFGQGCGVPCAAANLRIVPLSMDMEMHMFGLMYAPTDMITLMLMGNYTEKSMNHLTFAGLAGTVRRGEFITKTSGFGDTKAGALVRLYETPGHRVHLNLGLGIPTGGLRDRDDILLPTGARANVRLPYAMQIGTGTLDFMPGITYAGVSDRLSWGAQYRADIRMMDENSEGYSWGDKHGLSAWVAYQWAPWVSTSFRVEGTIQDSIDGIDPNIVGPVQTANPDFYGGERIDLAVGVNLAGQTGFIRGHRIAIEVVRPVYQDLNGPQMETDWMLTVGWQKSF